VKFSVEFVFKAHDSVASFETLFTVFLVPFA